MDQHEIAEADFNPGRNPKKRQGSFKDSVTVAPGPHENHGVLSKASTLDMGEINTDDRFRRLGWKRLVVLLIVEAVALGTLSLPSAFATLGMFLGIVLCIGIGMTAMYAAFVIGQVKLKYPGIKHYADIGRLLLGSFGFYLFSFGFVVQLLLVVGSHCLTGKTAIVAITSSNICSLVFSAISTIALILLAIPPSFSEVAILGYIDFISIIAAIGVTIIATGVDSPTRHSAWSAWPKDGTTFAESMTAIMNIVFAYGFAVTMPSFMDELHTPKDFRKSIVAVGIIEIGIYTFTGAILYAFIGQDVRSPALLSASPTISKIAFGLAFPVIFISGSINITVICRFIHGQTFQHSLLRHINTKGGWITWLLLVFTVAVLAWVISEAIPLFYELLSIISSLFVSSFSFYVPSILWLFLLKEGRWYDRQNIGAAIANLTVFLVGIIMFGWGTYSSVSEIKRKFESGEAHRPFTC
ncbi:unnamed protein product [Clonostachys byssicola]|uniref:Amino acid transporter transmembrane domain-containing protein n=1 Tax=Clonostachys byssicola TaxID=160290 RepID=A0A9N9UUB2_9HYPO|nr:unnamed protein product [Clonostachys byssicola]